MENHVCSICGNSCDCHSGNSLCLCCAWEEEKTYWHLPLIVVLLATLLLGGCTTREIVYVPVEGWIQPIYTPPPQGACYQQGGTTWCPEVREYYGPPREVPEFDWRIDCPFTDYGGLYVSGCTYTGDPLTR